MASKEEISSLAEALEIIEELLATLQDLQHRLEVTEDFSDYGVIEKFIGNLEEVLERYDYLM